MEIENFRESNPADKEACTFDIVLGNGFILYNRKLIRGKKGGLFLSWPRYPNDEPTGEKKWLDWEGFSTPQQKKDFEQQVMKELEPYLK